MRIALLNITSGGISRGYQKYLMEIIPRIANHKKVNGLLVGLPDTVNFPKGQKKFHLIKWLEMKPMKWSISGIHYESEKKIKSFAPDIVFIPTARFWRINGIPTINMIQNMEPFVPIPNNPYGEKFINWARYKIAYNSALRANRVIAISKFVREFMINKWGIEPEKIGLVYHGIKIFDHGIFNKPPALPDIWKGKFVFTTGSIRPARGLEDILYAMKYLKNLPQISGLVIAGGVSPRMQNYWKKLQKWIEMNNLSSKVCWVGILSKEEMAWCYKNCLLFIMASRVEACPNIALEAMSHGCICISTTAPPMTEIFNHAAIYYQPKDSKSLADLIRTVLNWDFQQYKQISEKAKKRVVKFSWDVCAEKTVAELVKATSRKMAS